MHGLPTCLARFGTLCTSHAGLQSGVKPCIHALHLHLTRAALRSTRRDRPRLPLATVGGCAFAGLTRGCIPLHFLKVCPRKCVRAHGSVGRRSIRAQRGAVAAAPDYLFPCPFRRSLHIPTPRARPHVDHPNYKTILARVPPTEQTVCLFR